MGTEACAAGPVHRGAQDRDHRLGSPAAAQAGVPAMDKEDDEAGDDGA